MKHILSIALAWLALTCAAMAQTAVPGGGGTAVPVAGPGVQVNLNSASDPTVNNDSTQGYQVGSLWQNSSTGRIWVARKVTAAAAVWTMLELADHPGYIANNWYVPIYYAPFAAGSAPGANSIRLMAAYVKERITINNLGLRVTTVQAAGNVQAAIYANNPTTMRPTGVALVSTASMSTTSLASVNAAASLQLEPGLYWWATNSDNSTSAYTSVGTTNSQIAMLVGSATQGNIAAGGGGGLVGLSVSQTFNTWPDLTAASFTEVNGVATISIVQFEVASTP